MAAHAGEGAPVTECASLFDDRFGGMDILEVRRMVVRRLEIRPFRIVALRTGERGVDLVVADQAVGHLRYVGVSDML